MSVLIACEFSGTVRNPEDCTGEPDWAYLLSFQKARSDHSAMAVRAPGVEGYLLVAEEPAQAGADESADQGWEVLGEPDANRAEQAGSECGQMEATGKDILRHCCCNGRAVGRVAMNLGVWATPGILPKPWKRFCPKGHDTWVCGRRPNHRCRECSRRQDILWIRANPGKNQERQRRWYEAHRSSCIARATRWRKSHPDRSSSMTGGYAQAYRYWHNQMKNST